MSCSFPLRLIVLVSLLNAVGVFAETSAPARHVVHAFSDPAQPYSFLDWKDQAALRDGAMIISAKSGRGGAGINRKLSLKDFADFTPVLRLTPGPKNAVNRLRLAFNDPSGSTHAFDFDISKLEAGKSADVVALRGESLAAPRDRKLEGGSQGFDLANIAGFVVLGNWQKQNADFRIEEVALIPPNEMILAERAKAAEAAKKEAEKQARAAEQEKEKLRKALAGSEHPPDGPRVVDVGAVDRDLLALRVQSMNYVPTGQVDYVPEEGDRIEGKGEIVPTIVDGKWTPAHFEQRVMRTADGGKRPADIGALAVNARKLRPADQFEGQMLFMPAASHSEAYRIISPDDPAYKEPVTPVAVHQKSKPNQKGKAGDETPTLHTIYLQLPKPLQEGATYEIVLQGLNTREAGVTYRHDSKTNRTEAIHSSHIGYRPDDPYKRAFLSLWKGTGGGHDYPALKSTTFELIDAGDGSTAFTGPIREVLAKDGKDKLLTDRNHAGTAVYAMDFSGFQKPGTYRVHVPGLGVGDPLTIGEAPWEDAFRISMLGMLTHRASIDLGPPLVEFRRPLNFHPSMMTLRQADRMIQDGESAAICESMVRLGPDAPKGPDAWGGYHDAGDWDRRSQHLEATELHLELVEMFPEYFAGLKLTVPETEASNPIPDLLDEALWNIDFYARLQRDDGGVRGGVESTEHPRPGEASWQESLVVAAFEADPHTSYRFASAAARAARLLKPHDFERSEKLMTRARKAWDWAETNREDFLKTFGARKPDDAAKVRQQVLSGRARAAAALLFATGEPAFDAAFQDALKQTAETGDKTPQFDAKFLYARLPDGIGDAELKAAARKEIQDAADTALAFAGGNAFGITSEVPQLPMMGFVGYFSVPGMIGQAVPRAHFLTGDPKYLAGTIQACNYSAGANPDNRTYTTGLGPNPPRFPLHIDSILTAQEAPPGITVYGQSDFTANYPFLNFAHNWFLRTMNPKPAEWPVYEAFTDIYVVPAINEYTVTQTIARSGYYWGYLAARKPSQPAP